MVTNYRLNSNILKKLNNLNVNLKFFIRKKKVNLN